MANPRGRPRKDAGPTPTQRLDALGIDAICDMFSVGKMQDQIARELGMDDAVLIRWLAADTHRSARARQARAVGAWKWDCQAEKALSDLQSDATAGDIARARELASHYRWRAKALGRAEYGDTLKVGGDPENPLQVEHHGISEPLQRMLDAVLPSRGIITDDEPEIKQIG